MSKQQWLTEEPGLGASLLQGMQLCREGFRRLGLTLSLSALLALSLGLYLAFSKRDYAPRVVIRVVEAARETGNMPQLKRQLGEYVRQAVLTSEPLYGLIRRHGLYPGLMRRNPRAALETFKEDIDIEVYQNYFVEERAAGATPRSARLTVSYLANDPMLALAVTRDLGELIIAHERAARREQALAAVARAEQARDALQLAWQRRTAQVMEKQTQLERTAAPDPGLQVELIGLLGSLDSLEREVTTAEQRAATLDLGAMLERRGIGLSFQVVDDGSLPSREGHVRAAVLVGSACFVLGLPLVAMAIGAFYPQRGRA